MNITFEEVTIEQLPTLETLASTIWKEYFITIISQEQINYMLEKFQSKSAMLEQITNHNYHYYFIKDNDSIIGYTGVSLEKDKLFLSKLYLSKKVRGQGIASFAFDFLETLAKQNNKQSIYLTVNKYNDHTIDVYKAKGFKVIDDVVTDIGQGYVMDDYIMEKTIL